VVIAAEVLEHAAEGSVAELPRVLKPGEIR